jgi:hypothetical protein
MLNILEGEALLTAKIVKSEALAEEQIHEVPVHEKAVPVM